MRLLLQQAPGTVTVASLNGRTAAHLAAERNQAEALQLLLAAALGLAHAASLLTSSTPLHSAARHGATDALQLLLAAAPGMADTADLAGAAAADQAGEHAMFVRESVLIGGACRLPPFCRHAAHALRCLQRPRSRRAAAAGRRSPHRAVHQLRRLDAPQVCCRGRLLHCECPAAELYTRAT